MGNKSGNKAFKASLVYILVSLINKGIGIITIPVFTRLLSTAEMGTTTTWISWMSILLPITSLSLSSSSFFIAMKEYEKKRDEYQSSALILSSITTIICLVIYLLLHDYLNRIFTLSTEKMIFMFWYLFFSPSFDMWILRQRYEYKVKQMAIVTVVTNISASLFALLLVLFYGNVSANLGEIRIYATYSIMGIVGMYFYLILIRKGRTYYNREFWGFATKVSVPLIIHSLAKNILDVSDRNMIAIYCGKDEVGIYGTLYQVSTLSLIVWTAINNAFVPYLYDKLEKNNPRDLDRIEKVAMGLILGYGVVSIGLTAIAPEIVKILTTEQYYEAVYIIPPIAAGIFLTCVYNLFADVILFHKKSIGVMFATLAAAVLNVVLNAIFIPKYGYQVAAYTTLATFILLSLSQGIVMIKVHTKRVYNMKLMFISSLVIIISCLGFNFIYKNYVIRYFVILVSIIVVFIMRRRISEIVNQIRKG